MRVLPTICVHMWRVSQVFSQSGNGSGGQSGEIRVMLFPAKALLPMITSAGRKCRGRALRARHGRDARAYIASEIRRTAAALI